MHNTKGVEGARARDLSSAFILLFTQEDNEGKPIGIRS